MLGGLAWGWKGLEPGGAQVSGSGCAVTAAHGAPASADLPPKELQTAPRTAAECGPERCGISGSATIMKQPRHLTLAFLIGVTAGLLALVRYDVHADDPPASGADCPNQHCEWTSWADMDGKLQYKWTCTTPGFETKSKCTWRLGDCFRAPCGGGSSPGYNFGTPNTYSGG